MLCHDFKRYGKFYSAMVLVHFFKEGEFYKRFGIYKELELTQKGWVINKVNHSSI